MKYITRNECLPVRMPKVYLTGRAEDVAAYRAAISKEILKLMNVAVFFDHETDEGEVADGEGVTREQASFLENPMQMQLVIVLVTGAFLEEMSAAREKEMPLAESLHIPMLPICLEDGLEGRFSEVCGHLHVLRRAGGDSEKASYTQKLNEYLKQVLVDDAMREQIRAAFRSRWFLSYRRIDRGLARKLVKMVHDIPDLCDVAIWYDEYLVPGKNFDNHIADSLAGSNLMLLGVTKSLLDIPNYVCDIEYPLAHKLGKTVVPIEMAATDTSDLRGLYSDIPPCVSMEQSALRRELVKMLPADMEECPEEKALNKARHMYYIGMAYLKGVDVEMDFDRAAGLLSKAAELGNPKAAETLADMYAYARGIAMNIEKAVYYQKMAVSLYEQAGQIDEMKIAILKTVDYLGLDSGTEKEQEQMLRLFYAIPESGQNTDWSSEKIERRLKGLAEACSKWAGLCRGQGKTEKAEFLYNLSLKIAVQSGNEGTNVRSPGTLMSTIIGKIMLLNEQGQQDLAEKMLERLWETHIGSFYRNGLALSLLYAAESASFLGIIFRDNNEQEKAAIWMEKAIDEIERFMEMRGDNVGSVSQLLIANVTSLARILSDWGDEESVRKALELCKKGQTFYQSNEKKYQGEIQKLHMKGKMLLSQEEQEIKRRLLMFEEKRLRDEALARQPKEHREEIKEALQQWDGDPSIQISEKYSNKVLQKARDSFAKTIGTSEIVALQVWESGLFGSKNGKEGCIFAEKAFFCSAFKDGYGIYYDEMVQVIYENKHLKIRYSYGREVDVEMRKDGEEVFFVLRRIVGRE